MTDLVFGMGQSIGLLGAAIIGGWIIAVVVALPLTLGAFGFTVGLPVALLWALNRQGRFTPNWPGWIPPGLRAVMRGVGWSVAVLWIYFLGPILFFTLLLQACSG